MQDNKKGSGHVNLRMRMILRIFLPALLCYSFLDYYILKISFKAYEISAEAAKSIVTQDIIISAVAIVILLITVLWVSSTIVKPIQMLVGYSENLAAGNTDFKVELAKRNDELGQLGRAVRNIQLSLKKTSLILGFASNDILKGNLSIRVDTNFYPGDFGRIMDGNNKIDDSICDLIRNIKDAAVNVADEAQQLSTGAQGLAQGSTEQASAIEEVSVTVGDVLQMTKRNSDNANRTRQLSEKVDIEAKTGSEKMKQLVIALDAINKSSSHITRVIKVIEDIAFQTNLLALNASVEAARAGVHGKGFAVVAEEVKKLANDSAKAAMETNELLLDSINKSKQGLLIGEDMEKMLSEIVESVNHSVVAIKEIAVDSAQQAETIEQVNISLGQISQVVQSNTATVQESAALSEEMAGQAALLMNMVSNYRIEVERTVTKPSGFNEDDY